MFERADPLSRSFGIHAAFALALIGIGWLFLVRQTLWMGAFGALQEAGPGMGILDWVGFHVMGDTFAFESSDGYCTNPVGRWSAADFLRVSTMWLAMVMAMMIPRYMLRGIASCQRRSVFGQISHLSGYITVWVLFCTAAVILHWWLTFNDLMTPFMVIEDDLLIGALSAIVAIGCLMLQSHPSTDARQDAGSSAFNLGLKFGAKCVGSCWVLMVASFALGLMNIVGMIALTFSMILTATRYRRQTYQVIGAFAALVALGTPFMSS